MLRVRIDDVRNFRDGRECVITRTSQSAILLLRSLAEQRIDELWLDHDLAGDETIWPVVGLLSTEPFDVGSFVVHAARSGPAMRAVAALRGAGHAVRRDYDLRIWTHEMSYPPGTMEGRGGSI